MIALARAEGLAVARGGRIVLRGVGFELDPGGLLWVRGPNGVGKSTLLRAVAGLIRPLAGRVTTTAPCALADERPALDGDLPLGDALSFWAAIDGRGDRVADALDATGLKPLAQVPVRMLSTGQRRRAGFARVHASGAPLWLLDEPANGLDRDAAALLVAAIAGHRAGGGGVILASHQDLDIADAATLDLLPVDAAAADDAAEGW